jgi:hypothetical protein
MDATRFDRWTRSLIAIGSRRAVTTTLVGGALSGLLMHFGGKQAAAKCVALGKKCDKKKRREATCCEGRCKSRRCRCRRGRQACGKRCCARGQICDGGQCVTGQGDCPTGADTCAGDLFACNGSCNCIQRFGGGTRCGGGLSGFCGACSNDVDCADLGPGAFCAVSSAPACIPCDAGLGRCATPCST